MGGSNLFVGINEPDQLLSEVFVYPNPASDFIQCNFTNNPAIRNVSLYDATGRIVLNIKVHNHLSLDVKSLTNGFYMLHFADDNGRVSVTKKILINH